MALLRHTFVDKIEILESGVLQVRESTYIIDDDTLERVAGPSYFRYAVSPGDPLPSRASQRVQDIAATVWTPEVVATYREKQRRTEPLSPIIPPIVPER